MKKVFGLFALTAIFSVAVFANAARFDPNKPTPTPPKQISDISKKSSNAAASGVSPTQTIVGGIFISLVIIGAGIWLARSQKK